MTRIAQIAVVAGLAAAPAFADTHGGGMTPSAALWENSAELIRTRDITGGAVYTTNEADDEGWEFDTVRPEIGADWNRIGEIEDVVLNRDGTMTGIVAEIGGFLDIGDKHVLLSVEDLNLVAVDGAEYAFVTRLNEEDLEALQDVDEAFWN